MKKNYFILLFSFLFGATACSLLERKQGDDVLLEVAGVSLYRSDIEQLVPANSTPEDSVKILDSFIKQWVTNVLMFENAKRNIGKTDQIDKLVENYRRTLLIHEYEQQLINQRLGKEISETFLEEFYQKYASEFLLKETMLRGVLIVVPQNAPQLKNLKQWLENLDNDSLEKIEKYIAQYAISYDYFLDKWMLFSDIERLMPEVVQKSTSSFKVKATIEQRDDTKLFLLKIEDLKMPGDEMPYEYAKPEIETILRNKQKIEFIQFLEDELYEDAVKNGKIRWND